MSDILEKLRKMAIHVGQNIPQAVGKDHAVILATICSETSTLCDQAADEIESLRAQLASIRQVAGAVSLESGLTFGEIKKDARHG